MTDVDELCYITNTRSHSHNNSLSSNVAVFANVRKDERKNLRI